MAECKKLFLLVVPMSDKANPDDKAPINQIRYAIDNWVATATDEEIEKGLVDIPDGNGAVFTLICRAVE